jgi:DNA-binding transcriptional ArsR family regulator
MVDSGYILAPPIVQVHFALLPAMNALESMREIEEITRLSGWGEWVTPTAASLPQERRDLNSLMFEAFEPLFFHILPVSGNYSDFLSYVDAIAAQEPVALRDKILESFVMYINHKPELWSSDKGELTAERLLNDENAFLSFIAATCEKIEFDEPLMRYGYTFFHDPALLQATIVEHLRWMWDNVVADEWQRVEPMLRESIAAFEKLDFSNMTAYEAIRAVTTRDVRGKAVEKAEAIDTLVFVPSAHIGPYIVQIAWENVLYVIFGARLPRGAQVESSALSRAELLTRLNALADDTRLRILELLTQQEELCAQDIIEQLDLSQSSVSRHLSQLSATGFITERRREVAKCYTLNTDRVMDTVRTLTGYLARGYPPPPPLPPRAPLPPKPPGR